MLINSYKSRYTAVREYFPITNELSELFILDRKKQQLFTYPDCKLIHYPFRGGILSYPGYTNIPTALRIVPNISIQSTLTHGTTALSSAYTAGSAGNAGYSRIQGWGNITISSVYFFIPSFTGTAASVTTVNLEIRSGTATAVDNTGPGLLASASINPGGTTGWKVFSGINLALSAGNYYWIPIADADGNGTNFANINRSITNFPYGSELTIYPFNIGYTTTNGGSTVTAQNTSSSFVVIFSDGNILGIPFASSAVSGGSNSRGLRFLNGFPFDCILHGLVWRPTASSSVSGGSIWTGTTGPTGTPFLTSTTMIKQWVSSANNYAVLFSTPTTLTHDTSFRAVINLSGAASTLTKFSMGSGADATLKTAMPGYGEWYWTENSAGVWSDETDAFAAIGLIIDEITPVPASIATRIYPVIPDERIYPTAW